MCPTSSLAESRVESLEIRGAAPCEGARWGIEYDDAQRRPLHSDECAPVPAGAGSGRMFLGVGEKINGPDVVGDHV